MKPSGETSAALESSCLVSVLRTLPLSSRSTLLFYFYKISWQYHMPRKKATPLSFPAGQSGDTVNSSPCPTLAHRLSLLSPVLAFHQCPHHGFISIPGLVASPFPCPFLQALPPLTNSYLLTPLFHSPPLKRPDESKS